MSLSTGLKHLVEIQFFNHILRAFVLLYCVFPRNVISNIRETCNQRGISANAEMKYNIIEKITSSKYRISYIDKYDLTCIWGIQLLRANL